MERKEEGETAKMDRNPGAPPLYAQLEQILKQQNNDQEILGNIYFRYYCPVRRHDPYASGYCFIKQIPHGQTYKDKDMKIFFFLSENHHENKPVYQHK